MEKDFILEEIRRIAENNGGVPPGRQKFFSLTGIKESDWYGKYWVRWGAALKEAGYTPNELQGAYDDEWLLGKLVSLIKELERFPVSGDLRMRSRNDIDFPSHNTFRRFGRKAQLAARVMEYCREVGRHEEIIETRSKPTILLELNCTGTGDLLTNGRMVSGSN